MSKSHFAHGGGWVASPVCNAQPAANPPAVTNAAWARLAMPPMPVTTTNERKTMASASPGARIADRTYGAFSGQGRAPIA